MTTSRRGRVSVAMATYNGEAFVRQQLESLAAQTVLPRELVVCDDLSSDCTVRLIEDFASTAPFTTRVVVNETRLGVADNFLKAASLCDGELIAFCDQDDLWLDGKIARVTAAFENPDVLLVIHTSGTIDDRGRYLGRDFPSFSTTRGAPPLSLDPWAKSPGFSTAFRATLFEKALRHHRPLSRHLDDPNRGLIFHDDWVYLVASALGSVNLLKDRLALYRQHPTQFVGAPVRGIRHRIEKALTADFATARLRTATARHYADYFDELAERQPDDFTRRRCHAAAAAWRGYGRLSARRDVLYGPDVRFRERAFAIASLLVHTGYRSRAQWGLGGLALLRDLRELVGVPVRAGPSMRPGPHTVSPLGMEGRED